MNRNAKIIIGILGTLVLYLFAIQPADMPVSKTQDLSSLIEISDTSLELGNMLATARGKITNHSQVDLSAIFVELEFLDQKESMVDASRAAVWDIKPGQTKAFEKVVEVRNITTVKYTHIKTFK